jgi:WD40 repeat protein
VLLGPLTRDLQLMREAQGNISKLSLLDIARDSVSPEDEGTPSVDHLDSPVTVLKVMQRGNTHFVVVGDEDGTIRIWDAE